MKMRGESLNKSEKSDLIFPMAAAAACWPTLLKNAQDDDEQVAVLKAKKNVNMEMKIISNKPKTVNVESKKADCICICSPTSHAGSFRCHLHRCSSASGGGNTNNYSTKGRENSTPNNSKLKPNKLKGHHPITTTLSRFGRKASSSSALKLNPCSSLCQLNN